MSVRYQVFISSTYRDLVEERRAVVDTILGLGHFPAGMELFPASDAKAWDVITRIIDNSDYYVLIVGGRYGSMDRSRTSYTQREYEYALAHGIPVLAFLLEEPIPPERSESRKGAKKKLASFRRRLKINHTCSHWFNISDLRPKVTASLTTAINDIPRIGWVRAERPPEMPPMLPIAAERKHAAPPEQGAAAHPPVVPNGFDPAAARDVLAGKADRLSSFAVWSDTPQGHTFWSAQKKRLESGARLAAEARDAILKWLQNLERAGENQALHRPSGSPVSVKAAQNAGSS